MTRIGWLGKLVALIAIATVLSGVVQMIWPAFVLHLVGGETGAASKHFFGIVGMFMVLFGGLALHGVGVASTPALLWSGLQKFGAAGAVALGVLHSVFSPLALTVASFDLVSGVLIILYLRRVSAGKY
jgi:hypothetical protein